MAATTLAVLVVLLVVVVPARGSQEGTPSPALASPDEALAATPPGRPDDADAAAAAGVACADLPLPRVSAAEVASCQRWFRRAAAAAVVAGLDSGARNQTDLALAMCGSPDCSAVVAAPELAGLSTYERPRVRLTASLSVSAAVAYVARYLRLTPTSRAS
jgi:hypothetical protein